MRLRSTPLLLALISFALTVPAGAGASGERPDDGAIIFATSTFANGVAEGGLYAARNGTTRQITDDTLDKEPTVSPDGRLVAFARFGNIWVTSLISAFPAAQLTSGPGTDSRPIFSADGSQILFERSGSSEDRDLYLVSPRGGGARPLTSTPNADEGEASFSADGRLIAFVRSVGHPEDSLGPGQIYSVRTDGSKMVALTRTAADNSAPHYSAAGIVFDRFPPEGQRMVLVMRRDGSAPRRLLPGLGLSVFDVSGDGQRLLYESGSGLFVKGLRSLSPRPSAGRRIGESGSSPGVPILSPSGRQVARVRSGHGEGGLGVIDAVSGRKQTIFAITAEIDGTFTQLGSRIAWQPLPR